MTTPRRKPSDDDKFWDGIAVTRVNRRFLFDLLALIMSDMQRNDGKSPSQVVPPVQESGVQTHR